MRTGIDLLLTERSLSLVRKTVSSDLFDVLIKQNPDSDDELRVRQLCAKVSISLIDEIDEICHILQIHKRKFIEMALVDAVSKSHKIMEDEGVYEAISTKKEMQTQIEALGGSLIEEV